MKWLRMNVQKTGIFHQKEEVLYYVQISNEREQQGDLKEAQHYLDMAITLDPTLKVEKTFENVKDSLPCPPIKDPVSLSCQRAIEGCILAKNGQLNEAKTNFEEAIQLDPKNGAAYDGLGDLYEQMNDLNSAEIYLKKSLDIDPRDDFILAALGNVQRKNNKLDEAEKNLMKSIEINQTYPFSYRALADLYIAKKQWKKAEDCLKTVAELKPDYKPTFELLKIVRDLSSSIK